MSRHFPKFILPILTLLLVALAACETPLGAGLPFGPSATPTATFTPTATPIPMALSVNGEGIPLAEFNDEVARYQQAQTGLKQDVTLEVATQAVLDNYVDTLLLEQGATAQGFTVDDKLLQSRIDALAAQMGGASALAAWESAHGYSEAEFRSDLRRQIAAAWMRDTIDASVPSTADQVHVQQILLYNLSDAQQALAALQAGTKFSDLAARYDPVTKGELGWFPKDYLPDAALEQAAFALQPGQYSDILQTQAGYHILYLVERDPARPLSSDALLTLQEHALQGWLDQHKNESKILLAP